MPCHGVSGWVRADRIAARADFPIYFIDSSTAIRLNGNELDVASEALAASRRTVLRLPDCGPSPALYALIRPSNRPASSSDY
jgi:hypothetical protein